MSYQIRSGKIFYLLVIAVILSLLMLLIPATPALAQPEIALSPSSGSFGTKVTITETHFESFKNTEIRVFFDNVEADNMIASLTMPQGTPVSRTGEIVSAGLRVDSA